MRPVSITQPRQMPHRIDRRSQFSNVRGLDWGRAGWVLRISGNGWVGCEVERRAQRHVAVAGSAITRTVCRADSIKIRTTHVPAVGKARVGSGANRSKRNARGLALNPVIARTSRPTERDVGPATCRRRRQPSRSRAGASCRNQQLPVAIAVLFLRMCRVAIDSIFRKQLATDAINLPSFNWLTINADSSLHATAIAVIAVAPSDRAVPGGFRLHPILSIIGAQNRGGAVSVSR